MSVAPGEPGGAAVEEPLYHQVAQRIERLIDGGTLRPGERIPSVRRLSKQLGVSVTTVLEAYRRLEDQRCIEARPQSGYYVKMRPSDPPQPIRTESATAPIALDQGGLILRLVREAQQPGIVPLGAATPSPELFPTAKLNRILGQVARRHPNASQSYAPLSGDPQLRAQIARRLLDAGCSVTPDDILITAGAQEAVLLALRAVTRPGDTVIVESPTYYALFQTLETLGLRALEVATDPDTGICLPDLEAALARQPVAACVLIPSYGNPLGHCMPEVARRELCELLAAARVPIIEDDIYGELCFDPPRPKAIKAFDRTDNVLLCSSISKTLAPGYRIGWVLPGRHRRSIELMKFVGTVATASPTQLAIAEFLAGGGFDRYLRRLRNTHRDMMRWMSAAIADVFPSRTRVTRPNGGHLLWVELPPEVDSLELHEAALQDGLSIAPGVIFSAGDRYRNFIRLNCALPRTTRVEAAVATLGKLVHDRAATSVRAERESV